MHKPQNKNLVAKTCKNTQSKISADLLDPEQSGGQLNSVSSSFRSEQEGRVTAVVAKARYQRATENQTKQRFEQSARSHPRNAVIKVLLDSGSDGDLMFLEKECLCISPTLLGRCQILGIRQMGASSLKEGAKSA